MNRRGFIRSLSLGSAGLMLPKKKKAKGGIVTDVKPILLKEACVIPFKKGDCIYPYPPTHFLVNGKFIKANDYKPDKFLSDFDIYIK